MKVTTKAIPRKGGNFKMGKAFIIAASVSVLCAAALAADAYKPQPPLENPHVYEGYELAWSDEFLVDGRPSSERWDYEHGFVRNKELQWYQPQNARVKDGCLIIDGKRWGWPQCGEVDMCVRYFKPGP